MRYQSYPGRVRVQAPAKLNLVLRVLGRRADGFHDLDTLMVSVAPHDTLEFAATGDDRLTLHITRADAPPSAGVHPVPLPADATNLVLKAAEELRRATGCRQGAAIHLVKRIPMAAGLAGGSSDAAAALVALNGLWRLGISAGDLMGLASRVGSDVPFFLCATGAAVCTGRGERVAPVALPRRLHVVVVKPPSGLSTAEVFGDCRPSQGGPTAAQVARELALGRMGAAGRCFHNALEETAAARNPDVVRLRRLFARQAAFLGMAMTGSGSSYFGLCHGGRQARCLGARLRGQRLGQVFATHSSL